LKKPNKIFIRITHKETGELIAEGFRGWQIIPLEGNYYIQKKLIKTDKFKISFVPGFCFYKFFYVWLNYKIDDKRKDKWIGWIYFLPNPLFFFIGFRIGLPRYPPSLRIEGHLV
jgi:uncharacterized protein (DUF427 family)